MVIVISATEEMSFKDKDGFKGQYGDSTFYKLLYAALQMKMIWKCKSIISAVP